MIREELEGEDGTTFVRLIPENEEDLERIRNMDPDEVDDRHSLADDPERLTDLDQIPPEDRDYGAPEAS